MAAKMPTEMAVRLVIQYKHMTGYQITTAPYIFSVNILDHIHDIPRLQKNMDLLRCGRGAHGSFPICGLHHFMAK
jgi:hypothetical protein